MIGAAVAPRCGDDLPQSPQPWRTAGRLLRFVAVEAVLKSGRHVED